MNNCQGCTKRHVGCHSSCEKYKELKQRYKELSENRQKELAKIPSLSKEHKRAMYNRMKGKK